MVEEWLLRPIPLADSGGYPTGYVDGWNDPKSPVFSPVIDTGEKLVRIHDVDKYIVERPAYHEHNYAILVRESVAQALSEVRKNLPSTYSLVIYDGWRDSATQKQLYDKEVEVLLERGLSLEQARDEAARYASRPTDSHAEAPAPHSTGGAVDVAIEVEGHILDFGSAFDQMDDTSALAYFEIDNSNPHARQNRRILYNAMTRAGFESYQYEWWHYNLGNQMATVSAYRRDGVNRVTPYGFIDGNL